MHKTVRNLLALTTFVLPLSGCVASSIQPSQLAYAPVKRNVANGKKCISERKIRDLNHPVRGIIEGNGSFLTPSWEAYVVDLDTRKLSRIQSVWAFEGGKMISKPNDIQTINLNLSEVQAVVTMANSIWASATDTASHPMTDVAWNIDLIDGPESKCEAGLGEAAGEGGRLTNTIYSIWRSHQTPPK